MTHISAKARPPRPHRPKQCDFKGLPKRQIVRKSSVVRPQEMVDFGRFPADTWPQPLSFGNAEHHCFYSWPRLKNEMAARLAPPMRCRSHRRSLAQTPHGASIAATRRGTRPPRCSKHRGQLVAPATWPDPSILTELISDHDKRYRGAGRFRLKANHGEVGLDSGPSGRNRNERGRPKPPPTRLWRFTA